MKLINTDKAPKAAGPYSMAVEHNGFIFCSGQVGINPLTNEMVEGLENQIHQTIKNLEAVLQEAGSDLQHILKTTIFVRDMSKFATVNEIYGSYFTNHKPARATIEVSNLPKNALVEIEAIATSK